MVSIAEDATAAAPHHRVDAPREADAEALHATRERRLVARLDDHVHVVALNREVDDAELAARAFGAEGVSDAREAALTPEVPDLRVHAERDVERLE